MTDFGPIGNNLPIWDRKIAEALEPLAPMAFLLILASAAFFVYLAFSQYNRPQWLLLLLVFIWSP
jgi:hypothetical protein